MILSLLYFLLLHPPLWLSHYNVLMTLHGTVVSSIQNTNLYTYRELRTATENFSPANKIGEGGFGSVYKVIACVEIFETVEIFQKTYDCLNCSLYFNVDA